MSYLYCSSSKGCAGGLGFSRYLESFDNFPESEFFDDLDEPIFFVPDFPFDELEVQL